MRLKEYEKFQEEYISEKPLDVWTSIDKKQAHGGKSVWSYAPQQYGVSNSLELMVPITIPDNLEGYATYLTLSDRLYYDAKFRASFMLGQQGTFGFVFRYIDQFNYYTFEISKTKDNGSIRILKMSQGYEVVLREDEQGGAMMNTWYDVQVKFIQRTIEVRWGVHAPGNMPDDETYGPEDDDMPLAFEVKDGDFSQGSVGFGVNGCMQGVRFTRIEVKPLECSDPNEEQGSLFVPMDGSRYKENFKEEFSLKWDVYDPVG